MLSTYQGLPDSSRAPGSHRASGLTDPAVLQAYVEHRVADPSLLSSPAGPSYADFFVTPTA